MGFADGGDGGGFFAAVTGATFADAGGAAIGTGPAVSVGTDTGSADALDGDAGATVLAASFGVGAVAAAKSDA